MTPSVLLSLASSGEAHPLLDFDGTAYIQLAIFLVVALIASRLIFGPYLKMRDERAAGTEGARAEASAMSAEADANLETYESKLATARDRANEERRKVRADAAVQQRELDESTRTEIATATLDAETQVRKQIDVARAELLPKAAALGGTIASRLLDREVQA